MENKILHRAHSVRLNRIQRSVAVEPLEMRVLMSATSSTGLSGAIDSTTPSPLAFSLAPGASASATIKTSVNIAPPIRGNVDVLFLSDTTGSMRDLISSVQGGFSQIAGDVARNLPFANLEFGAAEFKDIEDGGPYGFQGVNIDQGFTADLPAVQSAVNSWSAQGGGKTDLPEENLAALKHVADNWVANMGGRSDAQKIVIYASDEIGWENGAKGLAYPTLQATINSLRAAGVAVYALSNAGPGSGLDDVGASASPGGSADGRNQGSAITNGTGGQIFYNLDFSNVAGVSAAIESAVTVGDNTVSNISLTLDNSAGGWNVNTGLPFVGPFKEADSPVHAMFDISLMAPPGIDSRTLTLVLRADGTPLASVQVAVSTAVQAPVPPVQQHTLQIEVANSTTGLATGVAQVVGKDPLTANLSVFNDSGLWLGVTATHSAGPTNLSPGGGVPGIFAKLSLAPAGDRAELGYIARFLNPGDTVTVSMSPLSVLAVAANVADILLAADGITTVEDVATLAQDLENLPGIQSLFKDVTARPQGVRATAAAFYHAAKDLRSIVFQEKQLDLLVGYLRASDPVIAAQTVTKRQVSKFKGQIKSALKVTVVYDLLKKIGAEIVYDVQSGGAPITETFTAR